MKNKIHNVRKLLNKSNEAYYWIGFLLADGSVKGNKIILGLSEKDSLHLDKYKKFIEYNGKSKSSTRSDVHCKKTVSSLSKYGIVPLKTYNPPDICCFSEMNDRAFICMLAGFIDGDGYIKKLNNRPDSHIQIKCHGSWINVLNYFGIRSSSILGNSIPEAKIDKYGYANISISNSQAVKKLKKLVMAKRIPILKRKWDKINMNYISKIEQSTINKTNVFDLHRKGYKQKDICSELGLSPACVCLILKGKR